ncbi:MAG: class I SAM-dependent methyltransferase [Gammaproteobacteria bacterium]|nr:class I SAM-dependent methyltransferase [Gammaproteobacteria bacterium]
MNIPDRLERKLVRRSRGNLVYRSRMFWRALEGKVFHRQAKRSLKGGRYSMLHQVPRGGVGVEIGVWKGDFSEALLNHLQPERLYMVDPWALPESDRVLFPHLKSGATIGVDGTVVTTQQDLDRVYIAVVDRFADDPRAVMLRSTSVDAAQTIDDASLDWIYVDGSHYYDDVLDDLTAWRPKLDSSGVIFGDDYYWRDKDRRYTVRRAVDEFIDRIEPRAWVVFRGQFMIWL